MSALFVLGTGPKLDLPDLHLLDGQYTIGINYILESGYVPDVVFWTDAEIGKMHRSALDESGALLFCPEKQPDGPARAFRYRLASGEMRKTFARTQVYVDGNSGASAARWALSVGFSPVYLVGMSAEYMDGKSHFYPGYTHNFGASMRAMLVDLKRLLSESDQYIPVDDLKTLVPLLPTYDKAHRRMVFEELMRG